jgi:membrane fusion protein (multidrug efflux system)
LVPNADHALLVGMYAEVTLDVKTPRQSLVVPATALLLSSKGTQLAVVDGEDRVRRVGVQVERDTGPELVVHGLNGDERVIVNPGTDTLDGVKVAPVDQQAAVQPAK